MIEQYVAMYLPVFITAIGVLTQFLGSLKAIKGITKDKLFNDVKKALEVVISQNRALREQNVKLMEKLTGVHIDEKRENEKL